LILNDSKTLYASSDAQCQIRQRRICSTADSAAPNLTPRGLCIHMGHYYPTYNRFEKLILNDSKTLYASSDAQCQIRQRRICSTADSAAPNLTPRGLCIHMGHYYRLIIDLKSWYWMIVRPCMHPAMLSVRFSSVRICSIADSAPPNLTLSIAGCIQGLTIIQYQLFKSIISQ